MDNEFKYTYTAPDEDERKEIESILAQYKPSSPPPLSNIEKIKALDLKVKNLSNAIGIILGIIGTLIFGTGLAMILEWNIILFGVIVCIVGVPLMIIAYPVYKIVLEKQKQKE